MIRWAAPVDLHHIHIEAGGVLAVSEATLDVLPIGAVERMLQKAAQALGAKDAQALPAAIVPGEEDEIGQITDVVKVQMRQEDMIHILDAVAKANQVVHGATPAVEQDKVIIQLDDLRGTTPVQQNAHGAAAQQPECEPVRHRRSYSPSHVAMNCTSVLYRLSKTDSRATS